MTKFKRKFWKTCLWLGDWIAWFGDILTCKSEEKLDYFNKKEERFKTWP